MANIGVTLIDATGPEVDRAALFAHVQATAHASAVFSLTALLGAPAPDEGVRWTELRTMDDRVCLSAGMNHDLDCLFLAEHLARRFQALRVTATFAAEDDITFVAPAQGTVSPPRIGQFFQRTPDRSLAASVHLSGNALAQLAALPPVAGAWRRADEHEPWCTVYLRPANAHTPCRALVACGDRFVLLHDIDSYGGYGRKERLHARQATARCPDLASEIEHHVREHEAARAAPVRPGASPDIPDEWDIPI